MHAERRRRLPTMTAPVAGSAVPSGIRIDLNADLGEGMGADEALLEIVTSANIATGAHAGGGAVLVRAVAAAARGGVAIGAHPSYRDRSGFGRVSHLAVLRSDLSARAHLVGDLVEQILAVAREAQRHGCPLAHVKAHGSLYNEAVRDGIAAQVVTDAVLGAEHALGHHVAVVTQPRGALARLAAGHGLAIIAEGFADRGYLSTGQLVPRTQPGALYADIGSMVTQALDLAGGHVDPIDGPRIALIVESLCLHGDTSGAVAAARAIRAALEDRGWTVAAPDGPAGRAEPARGATRLPEPGVDRGGAGTIGAGSRAGVEGAVGADRIEIRAFGDRALLVEPTDSQAPGTEWVLRIASRARRQWPAATVVPGLASVLVAFDRPSDTPGRHGADGLRALSCEGGTTGGSLTAGGSDHEAAADRTPAAPASPPRFHALPTRYDGPDLADVAAMLGRPTAEVVRRHRAAIWTVAALGFSPGFGYLTTTDPLFAGVARRADPRARIPRGSVALAAHMCAVYPSATPGGWQLIGSTTSDLFDVHAEHPALLRVGDRVEFVVL